MPTVRLPAEFEPHAFVQIIFPHPHSDWAPYLDDACRTFAEIARAIARFEPCLIVCDDIGRVQAYFKDRTNLVFTAYRTNDTWARDCSGITRERSAKYEVLDFTFTGWGGKFDADRDNAMTQAISDNYAAATRTIDLILEGGAIESDGRGTLLSTTQCLLNPNRNTQVPTQTQMARTLRDHLGIRRMLWLHHGYLAGDDTDSHIDTLARFCDENTICYVRCEDEKDEHFEALRTMEAELQTFTNAEGDPYTLVPLPMTAPLFFDGERLPATYANFLILNGAVLVPTYDDPCDAQALRMLSICFPTREIIGIDCRVLIRQHGSLHCVTMQFPAGVTLKR